MRHRRWRTTGSLLAILAILAGLTAHGLAASDMGVPMATAGMTGEMSPSGGCDGCGGDSTGMSACAYLFCTGSVAVLPEPAPIEVVAAGAAPQALFAGDPVGWRPAPDPYPPRRRFLS